MRERLLRSSISRILIFSLLSWILNSLFFFFLKLPGNGSSAKFEPRYLLLIFVKINHQYQQNCTELRAEFATTFVNLIARSSSSSWYLSLSRHIRSKFNTKPTSSFPYRQNIPILLLEVYRSSKYNTWMLLFVQDHLPRFNVNFSISPAPSHHHSNVHNNTIIDQLRVCTTTTTRFNKLDYPPFE